MKYSILGFNQEKLLSTKLDLTDLIILQYIQQACGSTGMYHKLDSNGNPQVWVYHQKLIEDLPILRISEGTLRNRLSALNRDGYIRSTVVANENGRGSRTYYGITEMTTSLIYDVVERPCHEIMTSDNKLKEDTDTKKISNNKLLDITAPEKPKKKNLYTKCSDYITQYTNNIPLQNALYRFLDLRLEIAKKEGRPFYYNMWPSIVNELDKLAKDSDTAIKIVEQSITKGWKGFYALKTYNNQTIKSADYENDVHTTKSRSLNISNKEY